VGRGTEAVTECKVTERTVILPGYAGVAAKPSQATSVIDGKRREGAGAADLLDRPPCPGRRCDYGSGSDRAVRTSCARAIGLPVRPTAHRSRASSALGLLLWL
jgi:hypothetical protein